jgi:hypothetical protein
VVRGQQKRWRGYDTGRAVLALALLACAGCDPQERRPGLWLSGDLVSEAVDDWSFTEKHRQIAVQTRTWYGIAHSVTTVCFVHDGQLYVPSQNPRGKRWVSNVLRDGRVRLQIGGKLYDRNAVRVADDALAEELFAALADKYERLRPPPEERPELWFFRMEPREKLP